MNVETGEKVYVDPDTIRRRGDIAAMWVLYDSKTAQPAVGMPTYPKQFRMNTIARKQ